MKRLLLCLMLMACQPADTQSGSSSPVPPLASVEPVQKPVPPAKAFQTTSQLPDNPWQALAVLSPTELEAVRQAFLSRDDKGIDNQALRRKTDYMLQLLISAYQNLLHPDASHSSYVPPGAQSFRLSSHDGLSLKAYYVKAARPTRQAVILLHGYGANKDHMWQKYGALRSDYNLLLYDQRGHNGQSGKVTLGPFEAADLQKAIRWLRSQGNHSFALLGESMGGAVAIVGGAQWAQSTEQQVFPLKAVWSDAAYADLSHAIGERSEARLGYEAPALSVPDRKRIAELITHLFITWFEADLGLSGIESLAAPRLHLPALVQKVAYGQVHSSEDQQTSYDNARLLEAIARKSALIEPTFWTTTGEHVESWRDDSYAPRLKGFLSQAFARP